jgi:hypothetical protein
MRGKTLEIQCILAHRAGCKGGIVVTRRALLIYHFGIALILLSIGFVTVYAGDAMKQSSRLTELPNFDATSRKAIEEQQDLDPLRARALFYFDLAHELKKARNTDSTRYFYDARTVVWVLAALFVLGGLMTLTLPKDKPREPSPL